MSADQPQTNGGSVAFHPAQSNPVYTSQPGPPSMSNSHSDVPAVSKPIGLPVNGMEEQPRHQEQSSAQRNQNDAHQIRHLVTSGSPLAFPAVASPAPKPHTLPPARSPQSGVSSLPTVSASNGLPGASVLNGVNGHVSSHTAASADPVQPSVSELVNGRVLHQTQPTASTSNTMPVNDATARAISKPKTNRADAKGKGKAKAEDKPAKELAKKPKKPRKKAAAVEVEATEWQTPARPNIEYTDDQLVAEARKVIVSDLLKAFRQDILTRAVMLKIEHHQNIFDGKKAPEPHEPTAEEQEAGMGISVDLEGLADAEDAAGKSRRSRAARDRERRNRRSQPNARRKRDGTGKFLLDNGVTTYVPPPKARGTSKPKPSRPEGLGYGPRQRREIEDLGAIEYLGPRKRTSVNFAAPEVGEFYAVRSRPPPKRSSKQSKQQAAQQSAAAAAAAPVYIPVPATVFTKVELPVADEGMAFGKAPSTKLEFGPQVIRAPKFPPDFIIRGVDFASIYRPRLPSEEEAAFRMRVLQKRRAELWQDVLTYAGPQGQLNPAFNFNEFQIADESELAQMWDTKVERAHLRREARFDALGRIPLEAPDPYLHGVAEDEEDLYYVRKALERLRKSQSMHPTPPEDDPEVIVSRHSTGSARTEGFYKVSGQEKMANRPPPERPIPTESDWVKPPDKSGVAVSRAARVNNRGVVRGMELSKKITATDTDLINFNQLRTRKKQLTFARSGIEGYGLFAKEHIAAGDMVIEYVGELIRQQVADRREKAYERQGIGSSYLFRVDEDLVVDATKKGNLGRLINHCCVPNCTARIITINNSKKIVIYAKNNIEPGEEVTYDYHFAHEDVKIPCLCGHPMCRKYLN